MNKRALTNMDDSLVEKPGHDLKRIVYQIQLRSTVK
jgi:hypothetical protein